MDKIFESYLKELITGRTEELAWKAEKLPEELLSRHGVKEKRFYNKNRGVGKKGRQSKSSQVK